MTYSVKYPFALSATFLWLGFLGAISFMEAWLKFRAPGVTLPIGLSIGQLVFAALNKVEWILAIGIAANLFWAREAAPFSPKTLFYLIPFLLLVIQSFYLLPILDSRADLHIQGDTVPDSFVHIYYIVMECIKLICLSLFGFHLLRT
ncbi:MAG: hypothetical protein AAF587_41830 [Bacteroidota bacterium]